MSPATPASQITNVPELDVSALTPEAFWAAHVAARKPTLIRGHPTDMAWRASSLWTDEYLIRRAGGASVLVEVRDGPKEGYGRGMKRRMSFGEFVGRLAAGETGLYLTAQPVAASPDGHPQLLAEPLLSLAGVGGGSSIAEDSKGKGSSEGVGGGRNNDGGARATATADFPASLELAGHLVPQSLNMWMGLAPEGSSSGLHHDFHDNLYVLLRGKKRFRLYPPAAAPAMYTHGKLVRMYDNGRIVYEGQGDVLADGTDAEDVAKWRRRTEAEAAVAEAEAAVARGEPGAQGRLERCEVLLEEALDAELSDALEGCFGSGDGEDGEDDSGALEGGEGGSDDEADEEEAGEDDEGDEDHDDDSGALCWEEKEEEKEEEEEQQAARDGRRRVGSPMGKQATGRGGTVALRGKAAKGRSRGLEAGAEGDGASGNLVLDTETPPSFSRVPLGDPRVTDATLAAEFPRFPGRLAALEVTVEAGDMLYLPAGWFHEVTSYGSTGNPDGGHLAFNYWYHPPDNLDPSRRGFRAPYTSDFLPALWRARVEEGLPGAMEPGLGAQPPPSPSPPLRAAAEDADAGGYVPGCLSSAEGERALRGEKRSRGAELSLAEGIRGAGDGDQEVAAAAAAAAAAPEGGRRQRKRVPYVDGGDGGSGDVGPRKGVAAPEPEPEQPLAPGSSDGDGDLDPPRRSSGVAAAARALEAKLKATRRSGEGGTAAELTDEEYRLLMALEAARRRQAALGAMRAFFEKRARLDRIRRMRAALPRGRRHHPVIAVSPEVRNWRPRQRPVQQGAQQLRPRKQRGVQQSGPQVVKGLKEQQQQQ